MDRKILYYLEEMEKAQAGKTVFPVTCEIDPSNLCQCNCVFCLYAKYRKDNKVFLDWGIYRKLLKDLLKIGTKSITFTGGGEPLTHPKFSLMAELAWMAGFEIGLITNGIDLQKIEHPEDFKFVRISLDAPDSKTYLKVKGVKGFHKVLWNIKQAVCSGATVGLSYVVYAGNKDGIVEAQKLAEELGVAYIQFKPAWINGGFYKDYQVPGQNKTIKTDRFMATSYLPCHVAGLVGEVGATGDVFYCCQHRGHDEYNLGSLHKKSFSDIWKTRKSIIPDIKKCPTCRYMSYSREYERFVEGGTLFFEHKYFL